MCHLFLAYSHRCTLMIHSCVNNSFNQLSKLYNENSSFSSIRVKILLHMLSFSLTSILEHEQCFIEISFIYVHKLVVSPWSIGVLCRNRAFRRLFYLYIRIFQSCSTCTSALWFLHKDRFFIERREETHFDDYINSHWFIASYIHSHIQFNSLQTQILTMFGAYNPYGKNSIWIFFLMICKW